MVSLALYQPDIPQNTGTLLRMAACLGVRIDIIEPCGFLIHSSKFKRAVMDYINHVEVSYHPDFQSFMHSIEKQNKRLVLLTTKAKRSCYDITYQAGDCLLLGRESSGVPEHVHESAHEAVKIPMSRHVRSLNIAIAGAMVCGEACRQTREIL